jgi:serine/threonine-protein kinase
MASRLRLSLGDCVRSFLAHIELGGVTGIDAGRIRCRPAETSSSSGDLSIHGCMMWDQRLSGDTVVGQQIGSFRIESRLGAGSLANVYRGVNEKTGAPVAIKVARDGRESVQRRLWQSAEILNGLHHENIVRFLAAGRFHSAAYIATELISGVTLSEMLRQRGALPWPEVAGLGVQICGALDYLHKSAFLHRNLKPSHLMLNERGLLKLIGFGLAQSLEASTVVKNGVAIGTPGYMAPEQIGGVGATSNRTDLYSLGVVLWNLLTGLEPYQDSSESASRRVGAALAFVQVTQPPPRPSERIGSIPKELDDLVVQLMDQVPQKRPCDAAAVASVLLTLTE